MKLLTTLLLAVVLAALSGCEGAGKRAADKQVATDNLRQSSPTALSAPQHAAEIKTDTRAAILTRGSGREAQLS